MQSIIEIPEETKLQREKHLKFLFSNTKFTHFSLQQLYMHTTLYSSIIIQKSSFALAAPQKKKKKRVVPFREACDQE